MATIRAVPELCVCINTKLLSNKNNKSEICGGLMRNSSCVGVLNVYGKRRRCSRRWRVKAVARSDVNGIVRVIEKSSGGNVNGNRSGLVDIPLGADLSDLLAFEADRRAVNIIINSIGTELTRDDRRKLYSSFGLLYPYGHEELAICEDIDQVRGVMEKYPPYQSIFAKLSYGES